ncbi:hypothetical protein EMIT0158MI4_80254 [Burkholderia ambifaria]
MTRWGLVVKRYLGGIRKRPLGLHCFIENSTCHIQPPTNASDISCQL